MTDQVNVDLIWALTATVSPIDPGDAKYLQGWISEIPSFQNFNYVLQALGKNLLVLAESGNFKWQAEIVYKAGTRVIEDGLVYTCKTDHTNQNPVLDTLKDYWVSGLLIGNASPSTLLASNGFLVKDVNSRVSATTWDGSDITLANKSSLLQLNTDNTLVKNWLLGNVSGKLVAVDVGTTNNPDGRSIALTEPNTYELFHEGHPPVQSEVSGTIPDALVDGAIYARKDGSWVRVTSTVVSDEPPPPVFGKGAGWYNLADGQTYVDIDDGDSSQWVPASPPLVPLDYGVVQEVYTTDATYYDVVSGIPDDDTVPLATEGQEMLSKSILPVYSDSMLKITFELNVSAAVSSDVVAIATIVDKTAGTVLRTVWVRLAPTYSGKLQGYAYVPSTGVLNSFSVRLGGIDASVIEVNGRGSRLFGGSMYSVLSIEEIK